MTKPSSILAITLLFASISTAQLPKSDRITDGLKGPAKSVLTERADLKKKSGNWVEVNRRNQEAITYDTDGRRTTWKTYDYLNGTLFDSVIYRMIDGEKVSLYEKGDSPNKITSISTQRTGLLPLSDPRYDYKLKYKYDSDGNVTEEIWYQNDGSIWMRYTYKFGGNEIQELVYSKDGSLDQKVVHIFDKKENETQTVFYDVKADSIDEKVNYEYLHFDTKGNWTKRRVLTGNREGKFVMKPRETNYRIISYF